MRNAISHSAVSSSRRVGTTRLARAVAVASLSILVVLQCGPSRAQDWNPFRETAAPANAQQYDREFVREWEAKPPKGFATLSPANVEATKTAIKRYADIVAKGGWRAIPDSQQLETGSKGPAVTLLRERLTLSGDLRETSSWPDFFDAALEKAVKRFQAANGLSPTGIVDKRTFPALNVPAQARLQQLKANLPRLQDLSHQVAGRKYVIVNIPAAQIEAVAGDRVVQRHTGVVGKPDRASPLLHSTITELNFNPVWHLPPTVIEKDLIPKGRDMQRAGKSVLSQFGIDAYDGAGRKLDPAKIDWSGGGVHGFAYKQQPGKENPLGYVKINFDNPYSVYMHDTPSEGLFGRNFRAASSGCVRVLGIDELVAWILEDNADWNHERVLKMKASGETLNVRVKKPVPLYWVYITAWATEDGVVQFRRDVYTKDGVGSVASAY